MKISLAKHKAWKLWKMHQRQVYLLHDEDGGYTLLANCWFLWQSTEMNKMQDFLLIFQCKNHTYWAFNIYLDSASYAIQTKIWIFKHESISLKRILVLCILALYRCECIIQDISRGYGLYSVLRALELAKMKAYNGF